MTQHGLAARLKRLLDATSATTGQAFFEALVRATAEAFGTDFAFIGRYVPESDSVRVLAVWADGALGEPFTYALAHTPCANVMGGSICLVPCDAQALYPKDDLLVSMGIDSYAGIPLTHASGEVRGVLAAIHRSPMPPLDDFETLLTAFAVRAATEIERMKSEEAVRAAHEQFRRIVTTTLEGIWTVDRRHVTDFVNEPMARMLGHEPAAMLGRSLFEFMDEKGRLEMEAILHRRRKGTGERHEFRFLHADGRDVWTIMSTTPVTDADGEHVGTLAVVSDITERRGLELKVQHAQKLESLGVLAGGIAHDFNNLLVGILGNVGLALMKLPPESPVVPLIDDVHTAALRAADLTRQMLAYSGKGRFVIETLDVNRLVDEMAHLLTTVIAKNATLKLSLRPNLPSIRGDATQLRQVVMNLITNASDALGGKNGTISVSTGTMDATRDYLSHTYLDDDLSVGEYVYLEVSDTGEGMDAATRERIFDPFFTTKFAGRGLGLAATLGILRGHRGAIKVYSEPGVGSSFKVLLPVHEGGRAAVTASRGDAGDEGEARGTVLIVDDEPSVRKVGQKVLEAAGYTVLSAADGREGVEVFRAHQDEIVCVLLDMTMPRMNGEEAFRAMRGIKPNVRAVLSSGYSEQDATQHFAGKGLAGFVAKPWTPATLTAAVQKAILSATPLPPSAR